MSQPKMSELMRAAARGVLAPFAPPPIPPGQNSVSWTVNGRAEEAAKSQAGMFNALADVYEAHEKQR